MTPSSRLAPLMALGFCLVAVAASAQPRPGAPGRPMRGPRFNANLFGGWDAPLFDPSAGASLRPRSQWFTGADVNLSVNKSWRRYSMSTQANASNRYYPKFTPSNSPSYGGFISFSSNYRGRWQWGLSQFAHYAPLSAASIFSTGTGPNSQSLQLANAIAFQQSTFRQVESNSIGSLSYSLSRRTSVGFTLLAGTLIPIDSPSARALRLNGNLRLSRGLTRNLTGYFSYSVSQNRVASQGASAATNYTVSGFDFGVDFARGIQLTRNTFLGFRTGLVNVPETSGKAYQLTGSVTLDRGFRSGWNVNLTAVRDARFVQTYRNAVVFYGASASAGGRLTRSLGSIFSANYSSGTINAANAVGFNTASASVMLRYDVKRTVGTFVEYSLFRSDVDSSFVLPGQPSGRFGRQGVRAGLSFGLSPFSRP
ncbi:MAG: hypothetical protein AB7O28_05385 [Vicinamibacterales bacterium]